MASCFENVSKGLVMARVEEVAPRKEKILTNSFVKCPGNENSEKLEDDLPRKSWILSSFDPRILF